MNAGFHTLNVLLGLLVLPACSGDRTASFELTISAVPPPSHADLFDDVDTLRVTLADGGGVYDEYELAVEPGTAPSIEDLGKLSKDTVVEIEAYEGDGPQAILVARGRSPAMTVGLAETLELDIFVAPLGELVTFHELDTPSYAGALVSDGAGRFHLFGGTDGEHDSAGLETVEIWSLAPPDPSFQSVTATTMPVTTDEGYDGPTDITHRVHAHALQLDVTDEELDGKILVTGGWRASGANATVTNQVFLYDPLADPDSAIEELDGLEIARARHVAVPLASGEVIVLGGYANGDAYADSVCTYDVEIWDPQDRQSDVLDDNAGRCLLYGAAVALDDGALYCGGVDGIADFQYNAYGDCVFVERWGSISRPSGPETIEDAGAGLFEPAMAPLGDNRALLTGGLWFTGAVDLNDDVDATDRSFVYDGDTKTWEEKARMKVPRSGHVAAPLPDGRVLVAGGVQRASNRGNWIEEPIACVEIFDPAQNEWTLVDESCQDDPTNGSLPQPLHRPAVAVDPYYGILIWGGAGEEDDVLTAQTGYALYVPPLDE